MTAPTSGRQAGKTAAQYERLRAIAHPDDLAQLKLDLVIWGSCYLDADGRRIPPREAPPARSTRPLTEATPGALGWAGGCSGWYLEGPA